MANLAIKGHATRGSEVIELLEMLGGKNPYAISTAVEGGIYGISNYDKRIIAFFSTEQLIIFTLEEFLEKYPYKVGDKVRSKYLKNYKIEKMEWNDTNNMVIYKLQGMGWYNANELQSYKEETMKEKLVCNEIMSLPIDTSKMEKRKIIFSVDAPNETELVLGDNFEIKVEDGKTYVVKKKPQYPKTYEECCEVIGLTGCMPTDNLWYKFGLILAFYQLLICRDAYWKIAGEQMGLGKPWKPDWANLEQDKHCIWIDVGDIILNEAHRCQHILAFPTAEMRDDFYDNFKDLIEECKELL